MMRVLVVDDSAVARHAIATKLRARGCEVFEAESVAEAAKVDAAAIDRAVLDLELGDGDGVDVASRLRASRADLAIAFFTSAPSSPLAARASAIARVYAKPDEIEAIVAWASAS